MKPWYQIGSDEALRQLGVDARRGLSGNEVRERRERFGPNELKEAAAKSPWRIFGEQLKGTLVLLLIAAAIISALLQDYVDAIAIAAIVVLNAMLGTRQEHRAEQAMAGLRRLIEPLVRVRRAGELHEISSRQLVPGDILMLEAGSSVPADCRLIESSNLRIQEAALTGESHAVEKNAREIFEEELSLADRLNMVFMGTTVAYGRAVALVTETGMATELGLIAHLIQTAAPEPTPLQRRLDALGRALALLAVTIVTAIFVLGLIRGEEIRLLFLTSVSLAVAAVPEGLPAAVTIALALGAQRMLRRKALIRKLPAVESLGSVTVICSDKTGTLTQNQMTVRVVEAGGHRAETDSLPADVPAISLLLAGGALCNDASFGAERERVMGNPTEAALLVSADRLGYSKPELERAFPRMADLPFEATRKRMTTVHGIARESRGFDFMDRWLRDCPYVAFTKGAMDGLLAISRSMVERDTVVPLDAARREGLQASHDRMAAQGMRILGLAFRPLESLPATAEIETLESDLIFAGMFGLMDPPRPEAQAAIETCRAAGIRAMMITGDHPLTAREIARQLALDGHGRILTGRELDHMTVHQLQEVVEDVAIFARVSPEHKVSIIEALQKRGHSVAMTGDGVNDAPALKRADIGVAMGVVGTDVSREAADMVLQDDNFATIVAAVEEGRVIFDNIRRFVKYLLATNSAELWVMLLGPVAGMPLPLLPIQILWMNLVTDGLPALALGVEPGEPDIMQRPPRPPSSSLFGEGMVRDIVWIGLLMAAVSLATGYGFWERGDRTWQTMLFTTLTFSQLFVVFGLRSWRQSIFRQGLFSNVPLLGAAGLSMVLHLAVVYVPFAWTVFETVPLSPADLGLSIALGFVSFLGVELQKFVMRRTILRSR